MSECVREKVLYGIDRPPRAIARTRACKCNKRAQTRKRSGWRRLRTQRTIQLTH